MMTGKKKRQLRGGGSYALKVLIGLLFISPMIIGLLFSFQSDSQLGAAPLRLITENPTIENYIEVFRKVPLLHYLKTPPWCAWWPSAHRSCSPAWQPTPSCTLTSP